MLATVRWSRTIRIRDRVLTWSRHITAPPGRKGERKGSLPPFPAPGRLVPSTAAGSADAEMDRCRNRKSAGVFWNELVVDDGAVGGVSRSAGGQIEQRAALREGNRVGGNRMDFLLMAGQAKREKWDGTGQITALAMNPCSSLVATTYACEGGVQFYGRPTCIARIKTPRTDQGRSLPRQRWFP